MGRTALAGIGPVALCDLADVQPARASFAQDLDGVGRFEETEARREVVLWGGVSVRGVRWNGRERD